LTSRCSGGRLSESSRSVLDSGNERLDLAADAEIERKETRSQQLHLLGLREQDTRKQMRELETIIRRLRGI